MAHDAIPPDLSNHRSAGEPIQTAHGLAQYKPNWSYWANLAAVDVMSAVYLSLNIDPKAAQQNQDAAKKLPGVKERLDIALSNMSAGSLRSHMTEADRYHERDTGTAVKLSEFRAWGESLPAPFAFPDAFPKAAKPEPRLPVASEPVQDKPLSARERNNLLRIIRALDAMNPKPLPRAGYAESIRAKLDELGLTTVGDDTIRKVIEDARKLDA